MSCCGKPCLKYRFINQFGWLRVSRNFDVNSEFSEYIKGNGRGKSLITFEDNKVVYVHRGKRTITMTKEFNDSSQCVMTTQIDGIVSKRYFRHNGQFMYGNRNLVWINYFYYWNIKLTCYLSNVSSFSSFLTTDTKVLYSLEHSSRSFISVFLSGDSFEVHARLVACETKF